MLAWFSRPLDSAESSSFPRQLTEEAPQARLFVPGRSHQCHVTNTSSVLMPFLDLSPELQNHRSNCPKQHLLSDVEEASQNELEIRPLSSVPPTSPHRAAMAWPSLQLPDPNSPVASFGHCPSSHSASDPLAHLSASISSHIQNPHTSPMALLPKCPPLLPSDMGCHDPAPPPRPRVPFSNPGFSSLYHLSGSSTIYLLTCMLPWHPAHPGVF